MRPGCSAWPACAGPRRDPGITLAQAATLVDAALARGGELGLAPLTVAVLDPGGHLVVLKRQDGSGGRSLPYCLYFCHGFEHQE